MSPSPFSEAASKVLVGSQTDTVRFGADMSVYWTVSLESSGLTCAALVVSVSTNQLWLIPLGKNICLLLHQPCLYPLSTPTSCIFTSNFLYLYLQLPVSLLPTSCIFTSNFLYFYLQLAQSHLHQLSNPVLSSLTPAMTMNSLQIHTS